MYRVLLSKTALKQLGRLEQDLQKTMKSHLEALSEDPIHSRRGCDVRQLPGFRKPTIHRLRVGDLRAVYIIEGTEVKVTEIFRRRKGYRWLG